MPNLSIKNAPEPMVEKLRRRAERNHRSLQGELMAILELAAAETGVEDAPILTPGQFLAEVRARGLRTPAESVQMIRVDRDR